MFVPPNVGEVTVEYSTHANYEEAEEEFVWNEHEIVQKSRSVLRERTENCKMETEFEHTP